MLAGMRGLAMLAVLAAGCGSGSVGGDWLDGYRFRNRIDLHPSDPTALDDFPVAIVTDGDLDLRSGAAPDGSDIVITDADGRPLAFELEQYDPGNLALWVRIPTLAGPTSLWMYYGG